tara:strand:- start:1656 stop:2258 length:603 start_codon:yes stop_codon:yes gene_type:complete
MKLNLTIDFDWKPLKKDLKSLMADRMNKDMVEVDKMIKKGLKTGVSPVTNSPYAPISEVTKEVRRIRRRTRGSKTKPLVASGKMGKLKMKKVKKQGDLSFYGWIEMGADYGAYHLEPQTIQTNFKAVGRTRKGKKQGDKKNPKGKFFNVKGKKVPARIWFGVPQNFSQKKNFDRFMAKIKRKLKQGEKIINQPIGSIKLG